MGIQNGKEDGSGCRGNSYPGPGVIDGYEENIHKLLLDY